MDAEAGAPLLGDVAAWQLRGTFSASLAGLSACLLALLTAAAHYAPHLTDAHIARYYGFLTDVRSGVCARGAWLASGAHAASCAHASRLSALPARAPTHPPTRAPPQVYVMIFLGFGCLESFLRRYSHSAIALNLCLSALVMLEAVLACGWAQQGWGAVALDLPLLIDAAFAAGAAMISFGAVIGKATPAQLVWLLAAQVPLYAAIAQVGVRFGG